MKTHALAGKELTHADIERIYMEWDEALSKNDTNARDTSPKGAEGDLGIPTAIPRRRSAGFCRGDGNRKRLDPEAPGLLGWFGFNVMKNDQYHQ
jgi:hypothetical protein